MFLSAWHLGFLLSLGCVRRATNPTAREHDPWSTIYGLIANGV